MFDAYNPYNMPYNIQNLPQQQPFSPFGVNLPPSQQRPVPAPVTPQQTGPDWLQVPDTKQVEQVQVQPGGKAWVMVQNEPVFALRVADQMGLVTTSYYRFEKIDPAAMAAPAPTADYVTREEFNRFIESLRAPIAEPVEKEEKKK